MHYISKEHSLIFLQLCPKIRRLEHFLEIQVIKEYLKLKGLANTQLYQDKFFQINPFLHQLITHKLRLLRMLIHTFLFIFFLTNYSTISFKEQFVYSKLFMSLKDHYQVNYLLYHYLCFITTFFNSQCPFIVFIDVTIIIFILQITISLLFQLRILFFFNLLVIQLPFQ